MMRAVLRAAMIVAFSASAASAADPPQSFALRLPIRVSSDASVQRIALPGHVLTTLRRVDLGDLRVFDAGGRSMQLALVEPLAPPSAARTVHLRAYPILGGADALKVTGVSVKFDDARGARITGLEGKVAESAGADATILGMLLDTRALRLPAASLLLDADIPQAQPVTFTIESSRDLADWQPLASKVIYRAADPGEPLAVETIPLDGADLADHYLRVRWTAGSRLLSPVRVRGATLSLAGGTDTGRIMVPAYAPASSDPRVIRFALPFGPRLGAMRIVPPPGNMVIPVRLFGRNDREQAWSPLGETTVYRLSENGRERSNGPVDLPDTAYREFRIEADDRSAGFSATPRIELSVAAQDIAVLMAGTPPFVLAAGAVDAAPAYLPLAALLPGGKAEALPIANVGSGATAAPLALAASSDDGTPRQTLILWAALLLGTLALGGIVWALYRSIRSQAPTEDRDN